MENLREKYREQAGKDWRNSQGEPDIDYVLWLESHIINAADKIRAMYGEGGMTSTGHRAYRILTDSSFEEGKLYKDTLLEKDKQIAKLTAKCEELEIIILSINNL